MNNNFDSKQISEQLRSKGFDITKANIDDAQMLLVQFECPTEAENPMTVVRAAILRNQNPSWSDAQVVERVLKLQSESKGQVKGYGDDIANNIEKEIWAALEASGIFETVAENIQAKAIDAVLGNLSGGFNSQRFNNRLNALTQANQRFNNRSLKADESIIDAEYTESLDDVIQQCLPLVSTPPKLLTTGDMFQPSSAQENGQSPKKLLNGQSKNGGRN